MNFGEAMRVAREEKEIMGPSAIGAQPPPEDLDDEWLMMQEDEEGDEPFCNCTTGYSIEESDWNQCDSCGKPIFDEEAAVMPEPTFTANLRPLQKLARRLTELLDEDQWAEVEALLLAAGVKPYNASVTGLAPGKDEQ